MKLSKYLIVGILLVCSVSIATTAEDTTMVQIKNNTKDTADNTSKGVMEYVTFGVAILTLIVAGITLYYSKKTKDLQEKTERNTRRISLKHERTTLRQISWSLLKAFNNLTTIEAVMKEELTPAKVNFVRMKVDISELHIYDSFDYEIDSKGMQLLYRLHSLIREYNSLLDRRCDQSEYMTIRNNHNECGYRLSDFQDNLMHEIFVGWIAKRKSGHFYFSEEKNSILAILKTIDELYPSLFSPDENTYDDTLENKTDLIQNSNEKFDYLQNNLIIPYSENYHCKSGVTLDSCKSILNTEEADKYYSLLFIYYYNRVRPKLEEYLSLVNKFMDKMNYHHETNEMKEMTSFEFASGGLLDSEKKNNYYSHRLPVIDNYIEEVLKLIDYEVSDSSSLENRDIFISSDQPMVKEIIETEPVRVEVSENIPKENFIDVFDPVTSTLYLYADKRQFEGIIMGKMLHFNYIIEKRTLPLFFKHNNGQILCNTEKTIKSFQEGLNIFTKDKAMPYIKNDIKFLTLTYIAKGCNDSVTLKTKKIKFSRNKDEQKIKATITFEEITSFIRR